MNALDRLPRPPPAAAPRRKRTGTPIDSAFLRQLAATPPTARPWPSALSTGRFCQETNRLPCRA
eukprot:991655-Pyramimonas_sp.AAC.1